VEASWRRPRRWLADEEDLLDLMARLHASRVTEKLAPVYTSGELSALEKTCEGRGFAQRRDAAIIAVLTATGIRAGELAGIRYDPHDDSRDGVAPGQLCEESGNSRHRLSELGVFNDGRQSPVEVAEDPGRGGSRRSGASRSPVSRATA